jgi:hypothetical protein
MDVEVAVADEAAGANAIDRLATIFASDTVLASQFNDTRRSRVGDEGILKLWVAVLEDGIRCFLGDGPPDGDGATWRSRRWRLQQEAREWIFESNYEGPFSFPGLFEALGLDASYLRERLARSQGIHLARRPPVVARHGGPFR